jgi:aminopeptidase
MTDTATTGEAPAQEAHGRTQEEKLDLLAAVAVEVGLGLQRGQELLMTAPLEALPLARKITEHAYRAGAALVTTLYTDEEATLLRYHYAPDESFDRAAKWFTTAWARPSAAARRGWRLPAAIRRCSQRRTRRR